MIIEIFLIGVCFALILLFIAYKLNSFPAAYLSMFAFMVMGIFLFQDGLQWPTGAVISEVGATTTIATTYAYCNAKTCWVGSMLAHTFLYGGFVGLLVSTFFALKQSEY